MKYLVLALALFAGAAQADLLFTQGADRVLLQETAKCTHQEILSKIDPRFRNETFAGTALVEGKTYQLCWISDGTDAYVFYDDGDMGLIPMGAMKKVSST